MQILSAAWNNLAIGGNNKSVWRYQTKNQTLENSVTQIRQIRHQKTLLDKSNNWKIWQTNQTIEKPCKFPSLGASESLNWSWMESSWLSFLTCNQSNISAAIFNTLYLIFPSQYLIFDIRLPMLTSPSVPWNILLDFWFCLSQCDPDTVTTDHVHTFPKIWTFVKSIQTRRRRRRHSWNMIR